MKLIKALLIFVSWVLGLALFVIGLFELICYVPFVVIILLLGIVLICITA